MEMNNNISFDKLLPIFKAVLETPENEGTYYNGFEAFLKNISFKEIVSSCIGQTLSISHSHVIKGLEETLKEWMNESHCEADKLFSYARSSYPWSFNRVRDELEGETVETVHKAIVSAQGMVQAQNLYILMLMVYYRFMWLTYFNLLSEEGDEEEKRASTWQIKRLVSALEDEIEGSLVKTLHYANQLFHEMERDEGEHGLQHYIFSMEELLIYMRYFSKEGHGKYPRLSTTLCAIIESKDDKGRDEEEEDVISYKQGLMAAAIKEQAPNDAWLRPLVRGFKPLDTEAPADTTVPLFKELVGAYTFVNAFFDAHRWFGE